MASTARGDALPKRKLELTFVGWAGVAVVAFWLIVSIFAPMISPYDPTDFVSYDGYLPAGGEYVLGTDYLGRDILSRIIHGTRLTLGMAFSATLFATFAGTSLGLFAVVKGGWVDAIISRVNDAFLSFPTIMLGLVLIAALGSSIPILIITTGLIYASSVYRIARALAMDVSQLDYIEVARARGESTNWLLFHEILPNVAMPLVVDFGIRLSFAILFMSGLSFLGLGVQPPLADWGGMVRENMGALNAGSMTPIFPAIAIASLTIGLNLIVDDYAAGSGRGLAKRMS
jgi:peptide/nickel transport system permease protein